MGFLDYAGLQYLWGKMKEKFAPKCHSHDDRYYTEAEVNSKLSGKVDNTEAGANGLINKLESGTAAPVDNDLVITQWANHTTATATNQNKYVRRPMSSIWSYIKSKADGVYQPKGSYAASGHTHDDRYYTEAEVNTKLAGKSNTDHTHNTSSISGGNANYAGYAGPIESAHIDVLRANRIAFLPASGIKVEYSVDGGATWVDYGATDAQKASLFAMQMGSATSFYTGKHTKKEECTSKDQLRITITPVDRYASVNMLYLWVSVAGTSATVNISRSTIGAKETFTDVRTDVPISGWSGPNEIRFSQGTFGGGSTQTSNQYAYRFTFKNKADSKGSVCVMDVRMYGSSAWITPNSMMMRDHLYNWDANQNVRFPAQVTATKFNGSATSAEAATKLTSSAGSAVQPVYFKDGKPVAGTYSLGDASSKIVRTLGAVGNTGWANKTTDDKYVPTMSFMAYWNGAYGTNGVSNLQYCDRGRFGTIVTKNSGDYAAAEHTHNSVNDIGDNNPTTFAYSKYGMNYGDYTWLAGWNGYELRAVHKSQFAAAGHTHTKSQITDFPTSLKNPTALTIQTNGATAATYDGSAAKTVNITKGNIGLDNVDNTADANKSVKYATNAGSANGVIPEWSGSVNLNSSSWLAAWSSDGKKIKAMSTGIFATAGHTHNSVSDIGSGNQTTFAYSKDGMNYADYTWLAGWNGSELRAVSKWQFATAENGITASGSNYVRFGNGTQMCWGITNCKDKNVTASFAVAFNNTNYAVTIMGDYDSWGDTYWITGNHTTTSFAIKASGSALANRPINWMAVGTWK